MKTLDLFGHTLIHGSLSGGIVGVVVVAFAVLLILAQNFISIPPGVISSGGTVSSPGGAGTISEVNNSYPDAVDGNATLLGIIFYGLVLVPVFMGAMIGFGSAFCTAIAIKVFFERQVSSTKGFKARVASINGLASAILASSIIHVLIQRNFIVTIPVSGFFLLAITAVGYAITGLQIAGWYLKETKKHKEIYSE